MCAAPAARSPRPLPRSGDPIDASIIIAVHNEAENVDAVASQVLASLRGRLAFELIFVDDGSTDGTAVRLAALKRDNPEIRVLHHDRRCAKTAALVTGITAARGTWIATMDGDGQNDPADLLPMLDLARSGGEPPPIVAGIRARRHDTWSRRFATRFANGFRQAVLKDSCPDTGCGLKAFRRDSFLRLPVFEGMHRFLPALFQMYGHPLACHPVSHRARLRGQSKYTNVGRAIVGVRDLLGVLWLRQRTHVPERVVEDRIEPPQPGPLPPEGKEAFHPHPHSLPPARETAIETAPEAWGPPLPLAGEARSEDIH